MHTIFTILQEYNRIYTMVLYNITLIEYVFNIDILLIFTMRQVTYNYCNHFEIVHINIIPT